MKKRKYILPSLRDKISEKFPKLVEPRDMRTIDEYLTEEEIQSYIENPVVDECVFGDCLVPDDIDEALEQIEAHKSIAAMRKDGAYPEANIIMDFFVLWGISPTGAEFNKLPESRLVQGAKDCHYYFRNKGFGYSDINTDAFINVSVGNIYYINASEVWPDADYWTYGIAHSGSNGVSHRAAYEYCKNLAGTTGDGTRYAVLAPHKISSAGSTGTVVGFAYLAAAATSWNAGNVTIAPYIGVPSGSLIGSKTIIHEAGHSWGLQHTFAFTANDCSDQGRPCNEVGDKICDTPIENRVSGSGCFATNPNNHLSYSWHPNRKIFTPGQIEQMHATLAVRYPLVYNNPRVYWPDETPDTPILGCTDPTATNYNPQATQDDGSCTYPPPVIRGCTDSTATNYNPEATEDDGSCVYAPITPEVTFFEQMNVTDFGKEVEVSFLIKNATSYRITAIDDEYEFSVEGDVEYKEKPTNLIAHFKGEDFLEELGWRDSVSGRYALGSATEYEDSDGKGVMFGKGITEVLEFSDLRHSDYTYKIKFKPKVIGNVKSIISKRIHHSNNQSWLFLFTFTNNRIFWDNTTNLNRMDSGVTPVVDEVMNIHATRDLGMWINGVKVAESGSPNIELVNDAILRIGNDHTADNRGLEGVIYEIEIYNKSIEG